MVLLDLLSRLGPPAPDLVVGHVDHGIHPDSESVARLVARHAADLGLPFVAARLRLGLAASETRARTARHAALRTLRRQAGARWILTAHHADDQRETVLMRVLRGSGPAGLAGMRRKGAGLARPLLGMESAHLRDYAVARRLEWWEDPANADPRHLRSWLRASLLPQVRARLPDLSGRLDLGRRHAARGRRAWSDSLAHWPGLGYLRDGDRHSVNWSVVAALPPALRLALTQALVRAAGGPAGARGVERAVGALQRGVSGMSADVGGGWRLEIAFGRLEVARPDAAGAVATGVLETGMGELPWGHWTIRWGPDTAPSLQPRDGGTAWFIPGTLLVRPWQPGDRVAPLGGTGHRLAARCFQDARVGAGVRRRWPVFVSPGEAVLAWIPGVCRSALRVPAGGDPAVRVELIRHD